MVRRLNRAAALVLIVTTGLVGCHLTGGMPADLGTGHGRVDRTFAAPLSRSVRATIDALDELNVHPKGLSVRAMEAVSDIGKPGWAAETNAEFFPDDQSFHELFDDHVLNVKGAQPVPFNPVLVTYKGETEDGRPVSVVVRAQPPDATRTMVMVRVGRDGDEANGRKLLDQVTGRMPGTDVPPSDNPPASPPADLPALPN